MATPEADPSLDSLRASIDAVDEELLAILNRRALLAGQVGELKAQTGRVGAFYVPTRERAIVERLAARNPGPFPSEGLRPVFQEIFSACLSLEKPLRVAFLGPEATYTHQAAKLQFGLSAQMLPVGSIVAAFRAVESGEVDFGVVPVENATEGALDPTLDTFMESALTICAEIVTPISHCLMGHSGQGFGDIARVYSHPQALGQCREWIRANLPHAQTLDAPSTAEAARLARADAGGAAIASELAADLYDLTLLRTSIEDLQGNATRFLVLGRNAPDPSGRDRTSLVLVAKDGPGALLGILNPLAEAGVNLSRIESRPSRRRAWEVAFFLDLDGHAQVPAVASALETLRSRCSFVKVLGSYPRAWEPACPLNQVDPERPSC